jgi:predicted metal-dependent hydrolase
MTNRHHIEINGLSVEVVRKNIKNFHLRVYPPHGQVRVAVPLRLSNETIRQAITARLGWIRRHQNRLRAQDHPSECKLITGENLYFQGCRYQLDVIEHEGKPTVNLLNNTTIALQVRPGTNREKREAILDLWYRTQLRAQIPELIAKWIPQMGVMVAEWGIKKMKTRWGTCNVKARRIWLNLELAKKPVSCLEFILVHEMVHLLERHHNSRFRAFMDKLMPGWRLHQDQLNGLSLTHEKWANEGHL